MSLIAALAVAAGLAAAAPPPAQRVTLRQRVIVWGWRIGDRTFEERRPAYLEGMAALEARPECARTNCGFLLIREGRTWMLTNVAALSFEDLMVLQADVADSDTVVVFRQPPAPAGVARQIAEPPPTTVDAAN